MCSASLAACQHHLQMDYNWELNEQATADVRGLEKCCKPDKLLRTNPIESKVILFFQPKTIQQEDNLRGAGLVNLFNCWVLCLFSVGNNLQAIHWGLRGSNLMRWTQPFVAQISTSDRFKSHQTQCPLVSTSEIKIGPSVVPSQSGQRSAQVRLWEVEWRVSTSPL